MSELMIGKTIKIILGIFVFAVVVFALYLIFKEKVMDFFKTLFPVEPTKLILSLTK